MFDWFDWFIFLMTHQGGLESGLNTRARNIFDDMFAGSLLMMIFAAVPHAG